MVAGASRLAPFLKEGEHGWRSPGCESLLRGAPMLSPHELYPLVQLWVHALELAPSPAALSALTHLLVALLTAQSLRPSALMRALLSPQAVPARQRYKRVARFWERPWLTPAWLTP